MLVLAKILYAAYYLDKTGAAASEETSRLFSRAYFFYFEFMVDYPEDILVTVTLMHRLNGLRNNSKVNELMLETVKKYTDVSFFHQKVSSKIFDRLDDVNFE